MPKLFMRCIKSVTEVLIVIKHDEYLVQLNNFFQNSHKTRNIFSFYTCTNTMMYNYFLIRYELNVDELQETVNDTLA